jgi:hypothetical protein
MSWSPSGGYSPPPIAADMEDVQTSWGILPRWKARALALAEIQTVVNAIRDDGATIRSDNVGAEHPLHDEQKPPPLAADADEQPAPYEIPPEVLSAIEDRIADLTERLDRFERVREAEQALLDLEERMEQEMSPDEDEDDDDLLLN